jgi:hypothetical protein
LECSGDGKNNKWVCCVVGRRKGSRKGKEGRMEEGEGRK